MGEAPRIFLTILLIVTAALVATSPRLFRLRRRRPVAMLISGGWLAIAAGAALGPGGLGAVDDEVILRSTPLVVVGLGWIGLMIGLQCRRDVVLALPATLWRLAALDAVVSVVVFGGLAWLIVGRWVREASGAQEAAWLLAPAGLIAAAGMGWALETRSLGAGDSGWDSTVRMFIRGAGSLGGVLAVIVFGTVVIVVAPGAGSEAGMIDWGAAGGRLLIGAALAVTVGLLGRYAFNLAGRDRGDLLAVFIGVVALVAGLAAQLELSALFVSMLVGVVIANLSRQTPAHFERFILLAEHAMAIVFGLLAGMLLDLRVWPWGVALAVTIAATRFVMKPGLFRWALRRVPEAALGWRDDSPLLAAPIRQSHLAVAMAVGLVMTQPSPLARRLLAVVVLAGMLSEVSPFIRSYAWRSEAKRAKEQGA